MKRYFPCEFPDNCFFIHLIVYQSDLWVKWVIHFPFSMGTSTDQEALLFPFLHSCKSNNLFNMICYWAIPRKFYSSIYFHGTKLLLCDRCCLYMLSKSTYLVYNNLKLSIRSYFVASVRDSVQRANFPFLFYALYDFVLKESYVLVMMYVCFENIGC